MIYLLHNIGKKLNSNYNSRDEILNVPSDNILTFDGVYENVWENRDVLEGKDFILFVIGKYIGGDNSFDEGQKLEKFCDWNKIMDLVRMGGRLGWHTHTHRNLTRIRNYEDILAEVTPPFPMDYFAYPYGKFNERVVRAVKEVGYKGAYSVRHSDGSPFQIKRQYL